MIVENIVTHTKSARHVDTVYQLDVRCLCVRCMSEGRYILECFTIILT